MTDDQLISELARLDAAATKGPWSGSGYFKATTSVVDTQNVYGRPPVGVVAKVVRASQDGLYSEEKASNGELIEWIGTHRHRLLALLRREQQAVELLIRAGSLIHPKTNINQSDEETRLFADIDAFLATEKANETASNKRRA